MENKEEMVQVIKETAAQTATQPRWKSWAIWVAISGAAGIILQATGLMEQMGLTDDSWNRLITAIGTVLTIFGFVNNPTDPNHL